MTPAQSRAARALINWSQPDLAQASGTSVSTIRDFETGKRTPIANNVAALQRALESAGVIFVAENGQGPGVRLRRLEQGDRVKFKAGSQLPVKNNINPDEIGTVLERAENAPVSYIGDVVKVQFGDQIMNCTSQALMIVV